MQPPCKDCEERKPGCHSYCEEYLRFNKQQEDMREAKRQKAATTYYNKKVRKYGNHK